MKITPALLALTALPALPSCASTLVQPLGTTVYEERGESHPMPMYEALEDVPGTYEKIGLVSTECRRGTSWNRVVGHLQRKARELGGDALVLLSTGSQPESSIGFPFFLTVHLHSKTMSALVIRRVET